MEQNSAVPPLDGEEAKELAGDAVARTLRAERAAAGLSQAELAERAGIPRPTYLRYERGDRQLSVVQAIQLAQALGMSLVVFASRVEERMRQAAPDPQPAPKPLSMQELKQQRMLEQAQPMEWAADDREDDDEGEGDW